MKVKFNAEIIDDDGNITGSRTSEAGGIPSLDEFDLSTRNGFLRDFDAMEQAVLRARDQIDGDIAEEILGNASKKTENGHKKKRRNRIGARQSIRKTGCSGDGFPKRI